MIALELKTNSIQDRITLIHWLELAYCSADKSILENEKDLSNLINRLKREVTYYQTEKKFRDEDREDPKVRKELEEELHVSEEEIDKGVTSYLKQMEEKWQKSLATYHFMTEGKYDDAISYLKEHSIEDESLAYGEEEDYGGKACKEHLEAIQDMFIEFIHQECDGNQLAEHELYNDEIDEWYFKYGCKGEEIRFGEDSKKNLRKRYFFPTEAFLIKLGKDYYFYSETSGQGTSFSLSIFDDFDLKKLADEYGKSVEELKTRIAIDFDESVKERKVE